DDLTTEIKNMEKVLYMYLEGLQFENSCEIGLFTKLTNSYCLVANEGSDSFYREYVAAGHPLELSYWPQ
ncbi:hypothetical protein M8C21_015495, partial [Ambrosia artemisiifolia]